jgi:hypothetical protein
VYFPQAAVLFVPFGLLPVVAGEVLWRFANIGVFALGLRGFSRLAGERSGTELFPLMTLVSLPLAWDCARNGQATLAMTGLMLLAVVDVAHRRWWRATLWLALSVSLKPLALVLVLLVMAIDRPMTWRVLLGATAAALLPFLTQHPSYVLDQYAAFLGNTTTAMHVGATSQGWTSPFHALRLTGVEVAERAQTGIRIVSAFITLALCVTARRKQDAARSALLVFALSATYLILFSPRTENNTYAMLGPAIAAFLARAYLLERRPVEGIVLTCMAGAIMGGRQIERLLTPHATASWVSPLVAVLFAGYVVLKVLGEGNEGEGERSPAVVPDGP